MKALVFLSLLLGLLSGCSGTRTYRISKEEARTLLTAFVNQESERRELADTRPPREGDLVFHIRVSEQDWRFLEFSNERWVIATEPHPPDPQHTGLYVRASVDEYGKNPKLEDARIDIP